MAIKCTKLFEYMACRVFLYGTDILSASMFSNDSLFFSFLSLLMCFAISHLSADLHNRDGVISTVAF